MLELVHRLRIRKRLPGCSFLVEKRWNSTLNRPEYHKSSCQPVKGKRLIGLAHTRLREVGENHDHTQIKFGSILPKLKILRVSGVTG